MRSRPYPRRMRIPLFDHRPAPPPSVLKPPPRSVMKPPPVPRVPRAARPRRSPHADATTRPRRPPAGAVPNPRRPRVVRGADGGYVGDLFRLFPDLPWAARPRRPVLIGTLASRLRRSAR